MYRTIFVPALSDRAFQPSLIAALPYVRTFNAQLLALHVVAPITPQHASEMSLAADIIASQEEAMAELAHMLGRVFLDFCADNRLDVTNIDEVPSRPHPAASWVQSRGVTEDRAAGFARQSDLVVLTRREGSSTGFFAGFEEAMIASTGRPVLIAPENTSLTLPAHPVIAWNGSREAARAVTFAEPLLTHAKKVSVLTIGNLSPDLPSADDIAISLQRKGIKARAEMRNPVRGKLISEVMADTLDDIGGDLLVMGAYSHARWRETILGGVTKDILKASDWPVLFAH